MSITANVHVSDDAEFEGYVVPAVDSPVGQPYAVIGFEGVSVFISSVEQIKDLVSVLSYVGRAFEDEMVVR